jgi:hypothetical protein
VVRIEVESKVVGGVADSGAGRVFIETSARVTLEQLIRLAVQEQVREMLAHRKLDAEERLVRQYGSVEEIRRLRETTGRAVFGPASGRKAPQIDIEEAQGKALHAFGDGRYMVFVDAQQLEKLSDEVELSTDTKIQFVRVLPLQGG